MAELVDVVKKLKRPLSTESKMGYNNLSVIGGLDKYVRTWATAGARLADDERIGRKMGELEALFRDYRASTPHQRREKLEAAQRLLESLEDWIQTGRSASAADPAAGPEPAWPPTVELRPAFPAPGTVDPFEDLFDELEGEGIEVRVEPPPPAAVPAIPARPSRIPTLASAVQYLPGVGPRRAKLLKKLNLETIGDLFYHYPLRHENRAELTRIGYARPGEQQTFYGTVTRVQESSPRPRLTLVKVFVNDGTGTAILNFFNQPWIKKKIQPGMNLIFTGAPRVSFGKVELSLNRENYEEVTADGEMLHSGRIVPVYPLTEGLAQTELRTLMWRLIEGYVDQLEEILPEAVRRQHQLLPRRQAMREIHFPTSLDLRDRARRRLVFEEFLGLQVALAQRRHEQEGRPGIAFHTPSRLAQQLHASLPFQLTRAQQRVIEEIHRDMARPHPMNRLLQGDVGSGKTIVALTALLTAVENGYQAAIMAPTELLAEQHFKVMAPLVEPLNVRVELLTGSLRTKAKREAHERLASGETQMAIGTHALIQEGVTFHRLGFVIIDEQHRFGVMQRANLQQKGYNPDVLVMTATPIPRTLSLTVYGDLDVSVINEMPPGRTPVETKWFPLKARGEVYAFIRRQLQAGRQAYVVCPLIEESEVLEAKAAMEEEEKLRREFPDFQVGLVHGRLSAEEREAVMRAFREGKIHLLTSTTVIEVGLDVPNATVMLILNAERFGLAQLHQLRGRVGRGAEKSYCFLLTEAKYNPARADDEHHIEYREERRRMQVMTSTTDGFAIAEEDLLLRGPGELAGTRQSGLPEFRLADVVKDLDILEQARQAAFALIREDPRLEKPEHAALRAYLKERFTERAELAGVG